MRRGLRRATCKIWNASGRLKTVATSALTAFRTRGRLAASAVAAVAALAALAAGGAVDAPVVDIQGKRR